MAKWQAHAGFYGEALDALLGGTDLTAIPVRSLLMRATWVPDPDTQLYVDALDTATHESTDASYARVDVTNFEIVHAAGTSEVRWDTIDRGVATTLTGKFEVVHFWTGDPLTSLIIAHLDLNQGGGNLVVTDNSWRVGSTAGRTGLYVRRVP